MDTTQDMTQIAAELNKLPKPSSYNSLYILAQQAFEAGFRSMTVNELVVYLSKNLPDDLTRSEFIYEKFAPGSALPDPGREASVFLGAGTYSTPGGGPDLVLAENFNVVSWDGEKWETVLEVPVEVDLSGLVDKADIVDNLTTDDPDKPLSANMGAVIKPRILPEENEFLEYDRPEYAAVYLDKNNKALHKVYAGEIGDDINKVMVVKNAYDRPDLLGSMVVLDKNNKVLFKSGSDSPEPTPTPEPPIFPSSFEYVKRFWNPPLPDSGFDVEAITPDPESMLVNHSNLIDSWDDTLAMQFINSELAPYISKTELGKSGLGDLSIWRYDFKPLNPKYKVLLTGGTHANEKMYIQALYNLFRQFMIDWPNESELEWLRRCVHFIIVPCRSPYTLGFDGRKRGSRVIPETTPIPMSWTRSGTTVTMTFQESDFTGGSHLNANTYFTEVPASALEGKTSFGVISSSDVAATPLNAYRIGTVVNGRTITFTVPSSTGATSGTGTFQVWTDPNRNWEPVGTNNWKNLVGAITPQQFDNGNTYGFIDGKGTKPISLKENLILKNLINSEVPDLIYDLHSPAADHYYSYKSMPNNERFYDAISNMKEFSGSYVTTDFSRVTGDGGIDTGAAAYYASILNIPYATIEWGGNTYRATAKQIQDATRWLAIAITEVIKTLK